MGTESYGTHAVRQATNDINKYFSRELIYSFSIHITH